MQNHMSNLITVQIDQKMDDPVVREKINNKKDSESDSSSCLEYKKKTPQKKLKFSSSDSESDSESDQVRKNFLIEMITVDIKFLFRIL